MLWKKHIMFWIKQQIVFWQKWIKFLFLCRRFWEVSFCSCIIISQVKIIETAVRLLNWFNVILSEIILQKIFTSMLLHIWFVRAKLFIIIDCMTDWNFFLSQRIHEIHCSKKSVWTELWAYFCQWKNIKNITVFSL